MHKKIILSHFYHKDVRKIGCKFVWIYFWVAFRNSSNKSVATLFADEYISIQAKKKLNRQWFVCTYFSESTSKLIFEDEKKSILAASNRNPASLMVVLCARLNVNHLSARDIWCITYESAALFADMNVGAKAIYDDESFLTYFERDGRPSFINSEPGDRERR